MASIINFIFGLAAVAIGAFGIFFAASFLACVEAVIIATLLAIPFEWAWDSVMPQIFLTPGITLEESWFLLFGSTLLFKRTDRDSLSKNGNNKGKKG